MEEKLVKQCFCSVFQSEWRHEEKLQKIHFRKRDILSKAKKWFCRHVHNVLSIMGGGPKISVCILCSI